MKLTGEQVMVGTRLAEGMTASPVMPSAPSLALVRDSMEYFPSGRGRGLPSPSCFLPLRSSVLPTRAKMRR